MYKIGFMVCAASFVEVLPAFWHTAVAIFRANVTDTEVATVYTDFRKGCRLGKLGDWFMCCPEH
jgi:hypothetical protein